MVLLILVCNCDAGRATPKVYTVAWQCFKAFMRMKQLQLPLVAAEDPVFGDQ